VTPAPPVANATEQSGASPLQSACISRSPRPLGDTLPAPAGGVDATLAARILRRLDGAAAAG
jgi:hypothetical protein